MESMVNLICNGSAEFTPEVLVSLLVFCLVLDCIGSISASVLFVGRR